MSAAISALFLAAHLWCVGIVLFAPFWIIGCEFASARRPHADWGPHGRKVAWTGLIAMVIGALLGILLGWWSWRETLGNRLDILGNRIEFGMIEFAFSFVLLLAHRLWWGFRPNGNRWETFIRCSMLFIAGTNLVYHFPVLFEILAETGDVLDRRVDPIDSSTFRELILRADVFSQVCHVWLTSSMCGSITILLMIGRVATSTDRATLLRIRRIAGWVLLISAVLQIPVGMWVTLSSRASLQHRFADIGSIEAWILGLSIVLAIGLLHHAVVLVSRPVIRPRGIAIHCFILIYLMCFLAIIE